MSTPITDDDARAACDTFREARVHCFDEVAALTLAAEALVARHRQMSKADATLEAACALARAGLLKNFTSPCEGQDTPIGSQLVCAKCFRPRHD